MGTPKPADERDQWATLALMRFLLATEVLVGHLGATIGGPGDWSYVGLSLNPLSAVYGFFVISGFSIAASLERESAHFMARRAIRIWPLYIAALAFGLAVALAAPRGLAWPQGGALRDPSLIAMFGSALMLQTFVTLPIGALEPIWSRSSEWWLYTAAPALRRLSTAMTLTLIGVSLDLYLVITEPKWRPADVSGGLDFFTLAWLWITGFFYYSRRGTPLGFAVLVFPAMFIAAFAHQLASLPYFLTIVVVTMLPEIRWGRRAWRVFNYAGDLSYSLYLFHYPVLVAAVALGVGSTALIGAACFTVGALALHLVDYPARSLFRRRMKRVNSTAAEPQIA